ncbi:uncharacterized protein LOC111123933 [Crassostrea virginica]|uniref:Uncharacterized protein LOC111123933 n=1 Tax=Crassostrea virginica TaxID=6565 RepID=A0A8B8D4A9_CRAVI|nr:uncharacterized protein LOC111123933 [Crassostrea virginica]XP_022328110.1 uncharacterized protein LOC111127301 [Crassostrea virginica]
MSAMSEASLPVSWKTDSRSEASGYSRHSSRNGQSNNSRKSMNVASAKHSGMRHPSWREPKPLKAASRPATAQDDVNGLPRRKPSLQRSNTTIESRQNGAMQGIVNRLTAPTLAAKMKTIEFNKRTAFVDNNYYSWSNMAVYKDHQKMLYNDGGGIKRRTTASKR